MATGARVVGTTMLVLVLGLGGYALADAYDVAPGVMTLEPVPADAAPFPTAPAAVEPDDVEPALGAPDPQAPQPSADGVDALVDALVKDERINVSGVVVSDQLTGQVLAEHRADVPRVPASTQKLVTAVAALATLDGGAGVATRLVRGSGDEVVLVGGGDMMLGPDEGDQTRIDGYAGLGDLARAAAKRLKLAGLTEVTLLVDDTLFTGPSLHPTWTEGDFALGYVAPVTPLAVHIGATRTDVEYPPRYRDPAMAAAEVLADRLEEAGIAVAGDPRRGEASESATTLASVTSAPLNQVVQFFLEHSDNTITEVVSRLVALELGLPASFDGGTQAVLQAVARLGVDVSGATLADASGLADDSALMPQTLEQLVLLVMDPDQPALRPIAPGLPIAGLTGTLDDRFLTSPARGLVRAKTGSLNGIKALAGTVVTADGRQLAFAVLTTHPVKDGPFGARAAIDEFVTDLHECGCRG